MATEYSKAGLRAARSDRGAALVLVLLVVALLMTLVLEFDRSVRLEHRAAGNYRDGTAAFYLARAGVAVGQSLLEQDSLTSPGVDDLEEPWALRGGEVPLGAGLVRVTIVDEERFFPVNMLASNATWIEPFHRLLTLLQIEEKLADAIMDWIDKDDAARSGGAENSYYESLPAPYRARNGPIQSLDELRFVRGMTEEHYRRLAPYLTTAGSATFKVNLNTAAPIVIATLDGAMTIDLAERLVAERPFGSLKDVPKDLAPGSVKTTYAGVQSQTFTIEAEGLVNGISKILTIQIDRLGLKLRWVRLPA